jgi:Ca2+-binding RTX toxin-like protein
LRSPAALGKVACALGRDNRESSVRFKAATVGLAMLALLALLVGAPAALASTASLRSGTTIVFVGDPTGDTVTLSRWTDTRNTSTTADDLFYYIVGDNGGITSGTGCVPVQGMSALSACRVTAGPKQYDISTVGGDDTVRFDAVGLGTTSGDTTSGTADLGPGNDHFTGLSSGISADTVNGGDGLDTIDGGAGGDPLHGGADDDTLTGGAGNDLLAGDAGNDTLTGDDGNDGLDGGAGDDTMGGGPGDDVVGGGDGADYLTGDDGNDGVSGGAGNDQVSGQAGDDRLDGGPGDDSLEFAVAGAHAGVGAGADDLHGGTGVDLLSYLDHAAAIRIAIDELPGDGSAAENDNVHNDVETVIATTLADTLTGDDLGQDLYGNGGNDTIDGRGGGDLLNGGTGEDIIRGGAGDDAVEGSAGGDLIDGGPGRDLFEGDNECTALPCTGGADQILARDNEEDTVNCGVGADRATVDLLDIVATDSQQGCESIDRAALPVPAPGPGGDPAAIPAPAPTMSIRGSRGLRALVLKGMLVEVTCPGACRIRGRLILRKTVVAGGRRTRIAGATTRLRLKTSKVGRRQLKRRTKALMTLVIDVTDSAGTRTTLSKAITFKTTKAKKKTKKA